MNGTKMSQTEVKLIAVSVLWVWPVRGDDFVVTADNFYICKQIGPTSQQSTEQRGKFRLSSPPVSHCLKWTEICSRFQISWEVAAWPDLHFYPPMWYSISQYHVILSHSYSAGTSQQYGPAPSKNEISHRFNLFYKFPISISLFPSLSWGPNSRILAEPILFNLFINLKAWPAS